MSSEEPIRLQHPFTPSSLLRMQKRLRRQLRESADGRELRIAILGGSTTADVANLLEIFLLADGFRPQLYQSEYNQYFEDAVFGTETLDHFAPQYVYIHTTSLNIPSFPGPFDSDERVQAQLDAVYGRLEQVWLKVAEKWGATIIQNNFEPPFARPLGQLDAVVQTGKTTFINRLNERLAAYARKTPGFHVHDLHYLSSWFGLERWYDRKLWFQYKYAMSYDAIPAVGQGVASIIRAVEGKSKKCLVVDLDNTLWGGVVGDDGVEGIRLGQGTPEGEAYLELQEYLRALHERGVLLAVCSKNEKEIALAGLGHPDSQLEPGHFTSMRINWRPKDQNLGEIARDINIGSDSLVFLDDNPVERQLVADQLRGVAVPDVGDDISRFIAVVDKAGYFETAQLSQEDAHRQRYYEDNSRRDEAQASFGSYNEFLTSLEMEAEVGPFVPVYLPRISQLTNKTNQYNLTTRRYTEAELEAFSRDPGYLTLFGRLADRFGDNGLVTVLIGRIDGPVLHMDLWLMSCRVIKRDLEWAMFQELKRVARTRGIQSIRGYYIPTKKNAMVREHYAILGFELVERGADGSTVWGYECASGGLDRPVTIRVKHYGPQP